MGRRWWWCRLRRRRLLVAGLFRRRSEHGREVVGRLGPARRHGLPANISVPLTKLSGLKRYKVLELKFFDRAAAGGGAYMGPEDSFEMVTLYPGGVYTKSQLLKELETLVSCGMFDRVDLEGKAKLDGTLGLTVSFVESVWSAAKQKLSDSYHMIVAVCIFIYARKQRMHQALRTSESMLSNMLRRNAVSMIGFVVLRQHKRSFDEWLTGKMKKVIGLDDLLLDYFETGKDELKAAGGKSKHGPKGYNSDDEDKQVREKEINFCRFVEECEEQAKELDAGDDVPQWGQKVFGCQKPPSILSDTGVENCQLWQSFCGSEQLGFDLDIEQGEGFVEGMLMDGWLLKLVLIYGSVEDCIASWTLTKLLYSSNKKLRLSASDFWDSVLSLNEADKLLVNLGYFPSYSVLKGAVLSYGYLCDTPCTKTCNSESAVADTSDDGPPQNIIAWLRVVSACCKIRKMHSVFSPSEAEDLLVIVISLFLDRQLEGLLLILRDCLNSLILYFNMS